MSLVKNVCKFLKENTLTAVFSSIVGLVFVGVVSFVSNIRRDIFQILLFIIRKELFYVLILLAVGYLLLNRRIKNLERRSLQKISEADNTSTLPTKPEFFFSENANWKVDLARKRFSRSPYCVCCDPPSVLLELGPSLKAYEFFKTSNTHKCAKTDKEYSVRDKAYLVAYQRAKSEYGVSNVDLDKELEKKVQVSVQVK